MSDHKDHHWELLERGEQYIPLSLPYMGYMMAPDADTLWLSLFAIEPHELGQGHASAFLDRLPRDRRVLVPNVLSGKLSAMLERRGFHLCNVSIEEPPDVIEAMVREPEDKK